MNGENLVEKMKKLWLKYFIGYSNPRRYWDSRWNCNLEAENTTEQTGLAKFNLILQLMQKHKCKSILEVGCGRAILRDLPEYLGLDFSLEALKKNALPYSIFADITEKIPLPTNSQDAVLSRFTLLHISPDRIERAVDEICRVADKLILLEEPSGSSFHSQPHCWRHDLSKLFTKFKGETIHLES